jgi:hypothetical protein
VIINFLKLVSICFIFYFLDNDLLVGIARENLAFSIPKFGSERCEQFALGLQKSAPYRQLTRQSEIELQPRFDKRPGKSRPIIQNLHGTGARLGVSRLLIESKEILED